MGLGNYTDLKASIADHLDRDDLTDQIDDFIDLAEARHKREIRIREMVKRSQATIDASGTEPRYLALPVDFLEMRAMRFVTDGSGNAMSEAPLPEVTVPEITRLRITTARRPCYFAVHEEIEFDSVPDQDYVVETVYFSELTPLDGTNTTNGLLSRAPDAYLYGALVAATPFIMHDERLSMWADMYAAARDGVNDMERRRRHGATPVARVVGATP